MKRHTIHGRAAAVLLFVLGATTAGQQPWEQVTHLPCNQDHPGAGKRVESVGKKGDVRMARSVAGHTTACALERYQLRAEVAPEDIERTQSQMYDFLVWKLGTPALVASQFASAGYEHFDKAYGDEATAMLLGIYGFEGKQPRLSIPRPMRENILRFLGPREEVEAQLVGFLVLLGVPREQAEAMQLSEFLERNTVGVYMPKSFDIDNRLVDFGVWSLRNPPEAGASATSSPGLGSLKLPDVHGGGAVTPSDGSVHGSEIEILTARIAELEARLLEVEAMLDQLSGIGGGQPVENVVFTKLSPTDTGYAAVYLATNVQGGGGRLSVQVNGIVVGLFDNGKNLELTRFLQRGKVNQISFELEPFAETSSFTAVIRTKMPGERAWLDIYSFQSRNGLWGEVIELPIAP